MRVTQEALRRMRFQNPDLQDDLGSFLVGKSTKAVDGGIRWTFDPLHKTFSPRPFHAASFESLLETIATPTLVVAGERGFRLPDEKERVAKLRDHRFVEIADVGHMIHWFAAEALAAELVGFFGQHGA